MSDFFVVDLIRPKRDEQHPRPDRRPPDDL